MYPPMRLTMPDVWLLGERSSVMDNVVTPQKGTAMQEVLTNDREVLVEEPHVYDSPEAMDSPWDYDTREAMREVQPCLPGMEQPVQQWLPLWRLAVKPGGRTSCTPVPVEPNADPGPAVVTPVATRGIDWVEAVFAGLGRLLRPA
jgi:hypothetical protein